MSDTLLFLLTTSLVLTIPFDAPASIRLTSKLLNPNLFNSTSKFVFNFSVNNSLCAFLLNVDIGVVFIPVLIFSNSLTFSISLIHLAILSF